jgi:outer membrane receptor protein involved in Fe transport
VDLASYALADYHVRRVTLSVGARYDYIRIPFRNRIDSAEDTTSTFRHLSPRGGISIDVGDGASLYASVGESFRAPAILELGCADPAASCPLPFALGDDPPLDPVRATTYEIGARWTAGPVALSASVYRTDVRDEIFFVASDAALFAGYFTNIDKTQREGLELAARVSLGERVLGYANYAHTRAAFRSRAELFSVRADDEFVGNPLAGPNDVEDDDRLPLVPGHQAKAGVLLRLPAGLEAGLDSRFIGRQWLRGDEANETEPLDPYFVANARLAWSRGGWEVAALVMNVLDSRDAIFGAFNENRQTGELERFLTPMNPRTLKLIVLRELGKSE